MSLVVFNQRKADLLQKIVPYLRTCTLALFVNDVTPSEADTPETYTLASFNGSDPKPLTDLGNAVLNGDNAGETSLSTLTWTKGAGGPSETVYGAIVIDPDGLIVCARRRPEGPVELSATGQTFTAAFAFVIS